MTSGKHIRAVGQEVEPKAQSESTSQAAENAGDDGIALDEAIEADEALDLADYDVDAQEWEETPTSRFGWLAPALAIIAVAGWTAFYGWAMQSQLLSSPTMAPREWVQIVVDWSIPVLLVGVAWLLSLRHSRVEAKRFAQSAALLSAESRELEERLTVVNRELSLAREFLGAQSRELESLGRIASERIGNHAQSLQDLIKENGAQVEAIGSVSENALSNMTRLRDDLPVIANSARDVSNQMGAAGRGAKEQLDKLVTGFERLNQFGKASENQVTALDGKVGEILQRFQTQIDRIESSVGTRLGAVQERAADYRSEVETAEATALDALKGRMTMLQSETKAISNQLRDAEAKAMEQLSASKDRFSEQMIKAIERLDNTDEKAIAMAQVRVDELNAKVALFTEQLAKRDLQFNEQIARVQEQFSTNEAQATEVLSQRLADLDDALAQRREQQTAETEKMVAQSGEITQQIEQLTSLITDANAQGEATREVLSTGLAELDDQLESKRQKVRETQDQMAELTEAGVRLLEIIQSSARFSREDLPEAMQEAIGTLTGVEERSQAVSSLMLGTSEKANDLSSYLTDTKSKIEETETELSTLHSKVAAQSDEALAQIQGLRTGLTQLSDQADGFTGETQEQLRTSLERLEQSTRAVFETLDEGARNKVDALAQSLSAQAVEELERTLRNNSAEVIGKLEQSAAHASGVGREATAQLRDQLAKVNELTVNLEQRISRARELAEEQVNNDFSRRMALLTDSLNSSAIDLSSALSQEVSDSAWDAYLKGDRGIFTRRAVRLIDSGESREIAELYQSDDDFKANVSRYIHDFEAMLRSVLSTRDGKALGVTMLGSDIGKLYVVLAQAIERFRN